MVIDMSNKDVLERLITEALGTEEQASNKTTYKTIRAVAEPIAKAAYSAGAKRREKQFADIVKAHLIILHYTETYEEAVKNLCRDRNEFEGMHRVTEAENKRLRELISKTEAKLRKLARTADESTYPVPIGHISQEDIYEIAEELYAKQLREGVK